MKGIVAALLALALPSLLRWRKRPTRRRRITTRGPLRPPAPLTRG